MKRYNTVLVIAGLDPSGGAGLLADTKVCTLTGSYAMGVATSLTVQNTAGVWRAESIDSTLLGEQIEKAIEDIRPDAVKIGMVQSGGQVRVISDIIRRYELKNVVCDPVLVSTSGHSLIDDLDEGIALRKELLFPLCELVTPNLPESSLLGIKDGVREYNVLVKGGHGENSEISDDTLIYKDGEREQLSGRRIKTRNTHGTGCVLSSAIASGLAKGMILNEAITAAKEFLSERLKHGSDYDAGHGHGGMYLI